MQGLVLKWFEAETWKMPEILQWFVSIVSLNFAPNIHNPKYAIVFIKSVSILFIHVVIPTDSSKRLLKKREEKGIHIRSWAGVNSYWFTETLLKLTKPG